MIMNRIDAMKRAARIAGAYIASSSANAQSTQKSGIKDFVTVADVTSQDMLRFELKKTFSEAIILSEEDDAADHTQLYDPVFTGFVLDPIDGTYNFKRGMQESAISIGYIKNGESVAGVIYDPFKDELFAAEKGGGAFCNDKPIHVSSQKSIDGANIATSNGYDDAAAVRNLQREIAIYEKTGVMPWISCPGSAVLGFAWIAAGRVDALHHSSFKPWDNAAAFIIIREAGGVIYQLDGQIARFSDARILAGNSHIVEQLKVVFAQIDPKLLT
jgi:myo-inositol-1(or 4)-monophosphatase